MTTKSCSLFLLLGAGIIMTSCGAGKKVTSQETQINELQSQNSQLTSQVSDLKQQVTELTTQNKTLSDQFAGYKTQCEKDQKDLKAAQAALTEFEENIAKLQKKIEEAEAEFESKGLDVYSKNGVVYVDMKDQLLYKSGSAKLSDDGKKAIGNLASVLSEYPDLKVIVVGNTDTVHVKGVADNWSLSTERANGVVRTLVKDYKIDPARLTAAGKGKFSPVADNGTAEGRAQNRRTEIVLNPNLEKVWEAIKKE